MLTIFLYICDWILYVSLIDTDMQSERCLAVTDADLEVVASVYALLNEFGELIVEYSFEDERNARRNFCKRAIVDSDDTRSMATFFSVSEAGLPQLLDERCGIAYESTPADVEYCFGEALNTIRESGVQYHLK